MYSKYEVSMSNPVPGEMCTDDADAMANDNRQFMIVQGPLVDKPNEPIIEKISLQRVYTPPLLKLITYLLDIECQKSF